MTDTNQFMSNLIEISERIESELKRIHFNPQTFSNLAYQVLKEFPLHKAFNFEEILDYLIQNSKNLPHKHYGKREFGDFPQTLIRKDQFFIDLYPWTHSDTGIHDHHFSGAFTLLQGKSQHSTYTFEQKKELFPGFEIGKLDRSATQILRDGDVCQIKPQRDFIHQVIHQDIPTITLIIRSHDIENKSLGYYLFPGLRIKNVKLKPEQIHMLELIELAFKSKRTDQYLRAKINQLLDHLTELEAIQLFKRHMPKISEWDSSALKYFAEEIEKRYAKSAWLFIYKEANKQTNLIIDQERSKD
jgi:hypothetical protein